MSEGPWGQGGGSSQGDANQHLSSVGQASPAAHPCSWLCNDWSPPRGRGLSGSPGGGWGAQAPGSQADFKSISWPLGKSPGQGQFWASCDLREGGRGAPPCPSFPGSQAIPQLCSCGEGGGRLASAPQAMCPGAGTKRTPGAQGRSSRRHCPHPAAQHPHEGTRLAGPWAPPGHRDPWPLPWHCPSHPRTTWQVSG